MINMYQEALMDHYRYPRNRVQLVHADFASLVHNPSCGDSVSFEGCIAPHGIVIMSAFQGSGCVISQATASMLTQVVLQKTIDEILSFDKRFILDLIKIELGPMRLKCALLPLEALQEGLRKCKEQREVLGA